MAERIAIVSVDHDGGHGILCVLSVSVARF